MRKCRARSKSPAGLLLVTLVLCALAATAQQSGAPAKPSSNPFSALLKEKPKAPVVEPYLPDTIAEKASAIPLPDVAAKSIELGQKLRDASSGLPSHEQIEAFQKSVAEAGS